MPDTSTALPVVKSGIRPGRPNVQATYQLLKAELVTMPGGEESAFTRARSSAIAWLARKFDWIARDPAAQRGESFSILDVPGQRIEVIALPNEGLWTARLEHPDVGLGSAAQPTAGRTWLNDLSIQRTEGKVVVGVRIMCASLPDCTAPVRNVRPAIVRHWLENIGLIDVRKLSASPWMLAPQDIDTFYNLLTNPSRELPVVVLSQADRRRDPHLSEWVLDPLAIAKRLHGYAHVVMMPRNVGFLWTDRVGKEWSVYNGAVRTYMPALDFEEQSRWVHPLDMVDGIMGSALGDMRSEKAFTEILVQRISERQPPPWAHLQHGRVFIPDARIRAAAAERQRVTEAVAAAQEHQTANALAVESLKEQFNASSRAYEAELAALREQVKEAKAEAQEYDASWTLANQHMEDYKQQCKNMQWQLKSLLEKIKERTGESPDETLVLPQAYDDFADWVARHFPGRLSLHPRTRKCLKNAVYEDVQLVAKALQLLANEYWSMRLEGGADRQQLFETKLSALGLHLDGSITQERAGEQGEDYFVQWPPHKPRRTFIDLHLRKGKTKDDRLCLAIYFFWDEDSNSVVVCWLPSHLDNRLT